MAFLPVTNLVGTAPSTSTALYAAVTAVYVSPTSSGTLVGSNVQVNVNARAAVFTLNVAQCPPNSSQTLGVWVRHSGDGGVTFDDFVSFTTVAPSSSNSANNVTSQQIAQWVRDVAPSSSLGSVMRAPATRTLASGTVLQGPVGALWRVEAVPATSASSSQLWKIGVSTQIWQ